MCSVFRGLWDSTGDEDKILDPQFQGGRGYMLQMVERRGRITDWSKLCELVFLKYDKDQYQQQLRQLEMLKQTGSVADYHSQFEKLAHGILLYNTAYDDV